MKDVSWFIASCHDALSCHQRFSKWRWDQWIFGPPKIPFMMSGWNHLIQSSLILDFHLHIPFACLQYLARFCKVTKAEFSVPDVWWRSNDVCWRISGPSVGRLSNGREAPELTTTRGCQIVLGVALLEYDCMTGWGRFIIRRLSPERGHTSVCCSRRVYDYMWCASQGRNEVRYFLHVFITRCRTIWMRIPIDQSNDLICTMECDKRFEYFSLATVNWCSTFMLEGFSMCLPHMTHTHTLPCLCSRRPTGWLCMYGSSIPSSIWFRTMCSSLLHHSCDWSSPPTDASSSCEKHSLKPSNCYCKGRIFPKISHKAHNHGSGKLS